MRRSRFFDFLELQLPFLLSMQPLEEEASIDTILALLFLIEQLALAACSFPSEADGNVLIWSRGDRRNRE